MDLSRYANTVLHIGGHDNARTKHSEFKQKYKSLLKSLSDKNCKLVISGLLSRSGIDMRPYNTILKYMSIQFEAKFIDNHDSFSLASTELPFEYFQVDKVIVEFPGTLLLVQNKKQKLCDLP